MSLHRLGQTGFTSQSQILTILGGLSVPLFAQERAKQLADIDDPEIFYDPFLSLPGESASPWNVSPTAPGTVTRVIGISGGVIRLDTGPLANGSALIAAGGDPTTVIGSFLPNPRTARTYTLFLFRLNTVPDAAMALRLGMAVTGSAVTTMVMGVRGASSTGFFRFSTGAAGVLSTIPIDTNFHIGEMWTVGDTLCHGAIDLETPVSYTLPALGTGFPWQIIANGATAASQNADVDAAIFIVPRAS